MSERVSLRNTTGEAVQMWPGVNPVPTLVPADGVVEVDAWAAKDLKAAGWKAATKADRETAAESAAARLDELAAIELPPAADATPDDADGDATPEEN